MTWAKVDFASFLVRTMMSLENLINLENFLNKLEP
jgi:hypothetical protein